MGLEDGRSLGRSPAALGPPRASPRPPSDGARSRRRPGRPPSPPSSNRRPAPRKPRSAARRRPPPTPAAASAAIAQAAFARLCSPGTARLRLRRLEVGAPDDRHPPAARRASREELLDLGQRRERRVVVELDVRDDRDLGRVARAASGRTRHPRRRASPSPARRCRRAAARRRRSGTPGRGRAVETNAIIDAVVVLPCAPATTIAGRSATSSASSSPRGSSLQPRSGDGGGHDDLASGRDARRLAADATAIPCAPDEVDVRRLGPVRAPHLRPPCLAPRRRARSSRRRRSRRTRAAARPAASKRDQLLRDCLGGVGARERAHRVGHRLSRGSSPSSSATWRRRSSSASRDEDCATRALEVAGVLRLVVRRRVRVGDEERRLAGGGDLPDRAAGPRDDEIGRGERRAELVREVEQPVLGPRRARGKLGVVALAGQMQDRPARRRRTPRAPPRSAAAHPGCRRRRARRARRSGSPKRCAPRRVGRRP